MALLIITTILWAFSFSLIGEYLAGSVDSYFSVLMRVGLAALVFLPFLRTRGQSLKTIVLYMLVGAMQLGIMYLFSFRAYVYLSVSEFLLFTVLTPLYITLIYDLLSKRRLRLGIPAERRAGGDRRGDYSLRQSERSLLDRADVRPARQHQFRYRHGGLQTPDGNPPDAAA